MSCNNVNMTGSAPGSGDIDFYLAVAKGDFTGYSKISKFGRNPGVKSADYESIWDGSNLYPWPTAAETLNVVSDDTDDSSSGTGARTVEIEGLDTNWAVITETVTMNGTTNVTTTNSFLRVYRARVVTAGSTGTNEGTITFTNTSSSNVIAQISVDNSGFGQTLMAIYTIPAGKSGYLISLDFSSSKDNEHTFRLLSRDNAVADAAWNTKEFANARGGFNQFRKYGINKYTEKTDIDFQAIASASSAASGGFELILIDN